MTYLELGLVSPGSSFLLSNVRLGVLVHAEMGKA